MKKLAMFMAAAAIAASGPALAGDDMNDKHDTDSMMKNDVEEDNMSPPPVAKSDEMKYQSESGILAPPPPEAMNREYPPCTNGRTDMCVNPGAM